MADIESQEVKMEQLSDEVIIIDEEEEDTICFESMQLCLEPIVYTTRLDDMRIFEQINNENMTAEDIRILILKESLPRYKNQKIVPKTYNKERFKALKRKIDNINQIAKCETSLLKERVSDTYLRLDKRMKSFEDGTGSTENSTESNALLSNQVYLRNARLLKMCKPFSIVLNKIKLHEEEDNATKRRRTNPHPATCCLLIKDLSVQETNVYYIENGVITGYHTFTNVVDTAHIVDNFKKCVVSKIFCCWHRRDEFIRKLNSREYKPRTKEFMRKAHSCSLSKCTCCCRSLDETAPKEASTVKNISVDPTIALDIEIDNLENEISETFLGIKHNITKYGYETDWLENLRDRSKGVNTVVTKALNYTRFSPMLSVNQENLQKQDEVVPCFEKEIVNDVFASAKKKYNTCLDDCVESLNTQPYCCWYGRENIIRQHASDNSNIARLFKLPHDCSLGNCSCCCKPEKNASLKKLIVPLIPNCKLPTNTKIQSDTNKSTIDTSNDIIKSSMESKETLSQKILLDTDTNSRLKGFISNESSETKKQPDKYITTKNRTFIKILPKPPLASNTSALKTKNQQTLANKETPNSRICESENKSNTSQPKTDTTSNISEYAHNQVCTAPPVTDNKAKEVDVDSVITTVLDRFKDVRLTINETGKVAAALNAPVSTLTTAELKVLANILSHAQKQVQAMGLSPGSLLNTKDLPRSDETNSSYEDPVTVNVNSNSKCRSKPGPSQINKRNNVQSNKRTVTLKRTCGKNIKILPKPNTSEVLNTFSRLSQISNKSLLNSFVSHIEKKQNDLVIKDKGNRINRSAENERKESDATVPIIANVFSLKDAEKDNTLSEVIQSAYQSVNQSAVDVWSKSAKSNSEIAPKKSNPLPQPKPVSKIRVVDPAKLGIPNTELVDAKAVGEKLLQNKVLNENLITTQTTQPKLAKANTISVLPSKEALNTNIVQPLPKICKVAGNVVLPQMAYTDNSVNNNVFVINPLTSFCSMSSENVFIRPSNSVPLVNPVNINTMSQNIQTPPLAAATGSVYNINNLGKASISKPRLLNADPVLKPKKLSMAPPPLMRVAPKPKPQPIDATITANMPDGNVIVVKLHKDNNEQKPST